MRNRREFSGEKDTAGEDGTQGDLRNHGDQVDARDKGRLEGKAKGVAHLLKRGEVRGVREDDRGSAHVDRPGENAGEAIADRSNNVGKTVDEVVDGIGATASSSARPDAVELERASRRGGRVARAMISAHMHDGARESTNWGGALTEIGDLHVGRIDSNNADVEAIVIKDGRAITLHNFGESGAIRGRVRGLWVANRAGNWSGSNGSTNRLIITDGWRRRVRKCHGRANLGR